MIAPAPVSAGGAREHAEVPRNRRQYRRREVHARSALLSERLGFRPYYEPVAENPYLEDFYGDMPRWAFQSQVFFLSYRVRSHRSLMDDPQSVVQDRSLYEDAEVFARNLYERGTMSERDWATYRGLYRSMTGLLPAPDLVIYIKASVETLKSRIAMRGTGLRGRDPRRVSRLSEHPLRILDRGLRPLSRPRGAGGQARFRFSVRGSRSDSRNSGGSASGQARQPFPLWHVVGSAPKFVEAPIC